MTAVTAQDTAAGRSVIYVYGVARAPGGRAPAPLRPAGIVPDAPVEPVVHGDLMAFVSAVPADQFGVDAFRSSLNDTEWLKGRILAHEKVLEDLRSSYAVVPFRFGTIYLDSLSLSNALVCHRAELCEALDRIRGASEWGVKLYCDTGELRRRIETESAPIRPLRDALARASPGAGFFLQKKYAKALDDEVTAAIVTWIDRVRQNFNCCARASVEIEIQPAAVHGRPADMVMNAACLVADDQRTQFQLRLASLREQFVPYGFDHELTGPWPPYHFVSLHQEGSADAAAPDR